MRIRLQNTCTDTIGLEQTRISNLQNSTRSNIKSKPKLHFQLLQLASNVPQIETSAGFPVPKNTVLQVLVSYINRRNTCGTKARRMPAVKDSRGFKRPAATAVLCVAVVRSDELVEFCEFFEKNSSSQMFAPPRCT